MKQIIVLCASIMLGVVIVNCIIGSDNSILGSMRIVWAEEIDKRSMENWR